MVSRVLPLIFALVAGCAGAPPLHPAGGPYCFVGYADYFSPPQFVGLSRSQAEAMDREGRPFLVAYFDANGRRKSLFECHRGKCQTFDRDPTFMHLDVSGCPPKSPQRAVDAR